MIYIYINYLASANLMQNGGGWGWSKFTFDSSSSMSNDINPSRTDLNLVGIIKYTYQTAFNIHSELDF